MVIGVCEAYEQIYDDHIRSDDGHTYRQTDPNSIYSENLPFIVKILQNAVQMRLF